MTEEEAVARFRAAPRARKRRILLGSFANSIVVGVGTGLIFLWWWDYSWGRAAVMLATWTVLGTVGGVVLAWLDSLSEKAKAVEAVVPAELSQVEGPRIAVVPAEGPELVWWLEGPRRPRLATGQRLWLADPVARGELVLAVTDPADGGEPVVLWPGEVAWTRGRWDFES